MIEGINISCNPYPSLGKYLLIVLAYEALMNAIHNRNKIFPSDYCFYIIEGKRMDHFSLSASCSTDVSQVAHGCQVTCKA
jgi:hypothetical protein